MPSQGPLYRQLQLQPSAPSSGFDKFLVGKTASWRAKLLQLLNQMIACEAPSCGRAILGLNGNGKTLLNKALQAAATERNLALLPTGGRPAFEVMFSRISASQTNLSNYGVELAKCLSRSNLEPPETTYASIAAEILRRFSETYRPGIGTRLLTFPAKALLRHALKKYDDVIGTFLETIADDGASAGIDEAFKLIDRWLGERLLRRSFRVYARSLRMGSFLEDYIVGKGGGFRTVAELNRLLFDDLAASFSASQPQDIVHCLMEICRLVGTKVLMLQVDDCNDEKAVDFLLPIAERLGDFKSPKILVLASAVETVWKDCIARGKDLSLQQKIHEFFDPIVLKSPTKAELRKLAEKLAVLIQMEEAARIRTLEWPEEAMDAALAVCEGKSYRLATRILIDDAVKYIK